MAGLAKSCYIPKIVSNRRWLEALQSAICPKDLFLLYGLLYGRNDMELMSIRIHANHYNGYLCVIQTWIYVGLTEMWDKIKKTVTFILLCHSDHAAM